MKLYQIYLEFQDDFVRFARSLTHQQASAEDLVQQSYLKALDALELFEQLHPQQIKGWFFTTIKRLYIDEWRQNQRAAEKLEGLGSELNLLQSCEGSWSEALDVRRALSQLSNGDRTLLLCRYHLGHTSREIGLRMGMPSSTVRNQLAAAKRRFYELLESTQ